MDQIGWWYVCADWVALFCVTSAASSAVSAFSGLQRTDLVLAALCNAAPSTLSSNTGAQQHPPARLGWLCVGIPRI